MTERRPSGVELIVKARSAWIPGVSATKANEHGRSLATTVLRSTTGCAFQTKVAGRPALPVDTTLTHRHARYHDGQCSTSVSKSHTRSGVARITISLRTSIGDRETVRTEPFSERIM